MAPIAAGRQWAWTLADYACSDSLRCSGGYKVPAGYVAKTSGYVRVYVLVDPRNGEVRYVGRSESASPATGSYKRHLQEQAEILDEALTIGAAGGKGKVRLVPKRKAK